MRKIQIKSNDKNRFKKILDDAGRNLQTTDDYSFLDQVLPQSLEDRFEGVPFPYGTQPENRIGWK